MRGLGLDFEDERVDLRERAARLRVDLDAAGVFKGVHAQKRIGKGFTHDLQALWECGAAGLKSEFGPYSCG